MKKINFCLGVKMESNLTDLGIITRKNTENRNVVTCKIYIYYVLLAENERFDRKHQYYMEKYGKLTR